MTTEGTWKANERDGVFTETETDGTTTKMLFKDGKLIKESVDEE